MIISLYFAYTKYSLKKMRIMILMSITFIIIFFLEILIFSNYLFFNNKISFIDPTPKHLPAKYTNINTLLAI